MHRRYWATEKKCGVLEIFYHAELERKQLTKWKCWNVDCFPKYLTHRAGTSQLSSCYYPHHIIPLAKIKDSVFHHCSIIANVKYYIKAHILSNLRQLHSIAVPYIVVIRYLWTSAPPYVKLKKINLITKPKILHMVLIWSSKHRYQSGWDFI